MIDSRVVEKAASFDNKDLSLQFGKNLAALRKSQGLSRKDLAKILKVSEVTISSYERGLRQPNFETLVRLAEYFYVSVDELIGHFEEYIIEQYRLENAIKLLLNVGYIKRTSPIAYALYVRNDEEKFTKDADGNVKVINEGNDVVCFGGATDLIDFAESIQRTANSSQKTFEQVFEEKANSLFQDADAVKAGTEIFDYMNGRGHLTNPLV